MNHVLYIDASELQGTIQTMQHMVSAPVMREVLRRTVNDAGKKVKSIIRKDVPKEYQVTAQWAGSFVGWPKQTGPMQVVVPIKGARGSIGGRFKVVGARGRPSSKKRAKINAKIVRGSASTLPDKMDHQGGNPPFMWNGVAFTRRTNKPRPIVTVKGLSVPQMPLNRSEEAITKDVLKVLRTRLPHHFEVVACRK